MRCALNNFYFTGHRSFFGIKMAGLMDSEAHFEPRANEYGVPAAFLQVLRREGITTVGPLAFAVFRPGATFNEREIDTWAQGVKKQCAFDYGCSCRSSPPAL